MIVAFSTSSPLTSVALISDAGELIWADSQLAPGKASEVCMELLTLGITASGHTLDLATLFVADQGPGSFTGVRVGVVLAKTFAWAKGVRCAGIDAFDLISRAETVIIPVRKGEVFVREPGKLPIRTDTPPDKSVGYGGSSPCVYPEAYRAAESLTLLKPVSPFELLPEYRMEPSISTPKRPLSRVQV